MSNTLTKDQSDYLWNALRQAWHNTNDGAHDEAHIKRVRTTALALLKAEGDTGDAAALEAAAILHDFIPIEKTDPRRSQASLLAADAAIPHLRHIGFSEAQIAITHHAIVAHSWSAGVPPQSLEAFLLRDADRLDALGAIGVARCINLSGRLRQYIYHPEDPEALNRPLDDKTYCYDHFLVKLYGLADGLHSNAAKQEGAKRVKRMKDFWKALFLETTDPLA